jgi:hypothetical protein
VQGGVKSLLRPLLSEVNGTVELFVNVGKMLSLKPERGVIATNNAFEDALIATICRILQFPHSLLQHVVRIRETLQNCLRIRGPSSDIIASSVGVDNGELSLVRNIHMTLIKD